jgi:Protein kinase domain
MPEPGFIKKSPAAPAPRPPAAKKIKNRWNIPGAFFALSSEAIMKPSDARAPPMTEETLFAAALEKNTPAERAAFLDKACAGDAVLRARVEALLRSHTGAGIFLGAPAVQRPADPLPGAAGNPATKTEPTGAGEGGDSLDFLAPSEKPDSLGCLGHYEVNQVLGRGGMGIVFKAFDSSLNRVVAIKVLAPQLATGGLARRRFIRGAQAAAAVSHDHVVTIHAVEANEGLPFLVMQYVAGVSLQQRLEASGPLELKEILRIGMQTAAGLAAAHAQGLIHRDIKPANILLENGVERVKITDFGLARAVGEGALTQSGVVAGTPQYMSPEQAEGQPVDHRSDLFSLGSVLYALCTGRAPFRADTPVAVLKRVCEETPQPIRECNPEVPDWLVAIIAKLHAKNADDRFQSATEVAELLAQRLAQIQQPSPPAPPSGVAVAEFAKPRSRRRRWVLASAVLLVCGFGLGVAALLGVFTRDTPPVVKGPEPIPRPKAPAGQPVDVDHALTITVFAPKQDAKALNVLARLLTGESEKGPIRMVDTLQDGIASSSRVLVILMDDFQFEEAYSAEALKNHKVLGIGFGAAKLFEEIGLKIGAGNCAHGVPGEPRIIVEDNPLLKFESPFFLFDPPVRNKKPFHSDIVFGVYVGDKKPEVRRELDVIALFTAYRNYAPVTAQGNFVLIGVNSHIENWSETFQRFVGEVARALGRPSRK